MILILLKDVFKGFQTLFIMVRGKVIPIFSLDMLSQHVPRKVPPGQFPLPFLHGVRHSPSPSMHHLHPPSTTWSDLLLSVPCTKLIKADRLGSRLTLTTLRIHDMFGTIRQKSGSEYIINPEVRIRIPDHFWLKLDTLAEVCVLWVQSSLFRGGRFRKPSVI